ncbi:MAG: hypothetical protein CO073_02040 [Candidatus Komeilibacteria bacterium CG_4_9_14_0_8_um_filter_36_9]|uniref:Uncharacterized protein n=1 Tax=Candidatus Komeilibacteria bacterium CG_4_9_14_0_8_um_filter_36_9 TaxID=1974473 RepID=A0A2M8DRD0_9BACT|nr:MAG: hypothetical protein CO073_02040 [Candidatus Komeilibacteria bacterium CG_4_9_14_0_8_um_filter_36_9]
MPYFNTNSETLAKKLCACLNKQLGYNGVYYFTRKNLFYANKYGKHQVKINKGQAMKLNIDPKIGCEFTEEEIIELLKQND